MAKEDFLDHPELMNVAAFINMISFYPSRTTSGAASWRDDTSNITYSVEEGGQAALAKSIRDQYSSVFGGTLMLERLSGTTAERPATAEVGEIYFDTTLGKPIWKNVSNWVDATGAAV